MIRALCLCLIAFPSLIWAEQPDRFHELLTRQACAIGPENAEVFKNAGLSDRDILFRTTKAVSQQKAYLDGLWVVWKSEFCIIRPPKIALPFSMQEAWTASTFLRGRADEGDDPNACFLNVPEFRRALGQRFGWNSEQSFVAYLQFFAAGISDGTVRFYSEDVLHTPRGVLVRGRERCGPLKNAEALDASHAQLIAHFDPLLRGLGLETRCDGSRFQTLGAVSQLDLQQLLEANSNADLGFEVFVIAVGSGWPIGVSETERGRLRPPLCTHWPEWILD